MGCQACAITFRGRHATPLYRLKPASHRGAELLTALAQAVAVAAAVAVVGHRHATITRWLTPAAEQRATLHDHFFRDLQLPHIHLDQSRTRLRRRAQCLWLWLAIDPITKLVPVRHVRSRTQEAAHAVIHDRRQRLARGCLPVFSSDGL